MNAPVDPSKLAQVSLDDKYTLGKGRVFLTGTQALVRLALLQRERDVLAGAADGETAEQTGARLYLSSETVKSYRKRVIAKLGARNGTHAVALALRLKGVDFRPEELDYWELAGNVGWAIGCLTQAQRHLTGQDRSVELAVLGRLGAEVEYEICHLLEQAGV